MTEYNVQQKQFIQEYKTRYHLENKSDEQIMLFIQKDMQTTGVVYPGFENLVKPQNKPAYTGQMFGNSTTSNDMAGVAIEHGSSATAVKEPEKEIITDDNGNEVAVVKNGDEVVEATVTQTDSNGNKIETVVSYENGKPVKQIKKQNGNVSSVTKFTYNEPTENMPFPSVTVETIDGGKNKIITTALETDEYGNVDQEDFISRKTISRDGTETTVIIGSECIKEDKVKIDGKKVSTLYNGTNLADFDNNKLHRVAQETEIDGVKRYAEYDGKGNTKTTVQNGESPALIAQKFNVKEQALMRLNPQKGKHAITQVGADILIPGEFNADSYPMRVRKSKAESLNKYSQFEARRLAKEINSGDVENVKLAQSYNNVYELAKDNLIKSGVKNPSNQQVNDEANKLILLNGKNVNLKAGASVKVAKSFTNSKQASELTKYGFQASAENRIFFQKFNALNPQQKQNVLSAIQYCKSQKITNPSDIKAKVLETLGINLFDSDKTVPMVADNNYGVMAYQRNSKPISIETFVKDHLKLDLKSEPGKTVLDRLSQVEQTKLNKISAKDFKGISNKTFDGVASMLETVGVQVRTQAEINVKNNTPRAKAEKEKRAVRTAAAENIALAYDNAINVIKNYQGNQGWMNIGFYREKLGQLLDKVNPTDVATCFDAVIKQLEKEKQFAVSRLKTASANESEFKQAFKNLTGKDYNENAVKNFLAQAQKGGDWSKSYDQAFGDKVVKRATDKVNFQQYVDGAGDIVLMLLGTEAIGKGVAWAGGKVATKLAPYVPKVLSNLGAKGIMTIGNSTVTVGKVVGNMATSAATFTAWDATKNYINLKTKDIQYTGEDAVKEWQTYKEGNIESGKFGAFAGLLNSTVVGKVVNGTMKIFEKPVAKAVQGVAKTLEKGEATGADVMKTFIAKQTPGMIAQTAGAVAEVAGFTMYETANEITKELLQTDSNGQRHLPKDLTEEGLTNYLWKHLKGQATNLGEIKAISKLIFMHKGAVVERERMMNENLSKCEMLGKVKVQKAEVDGAEIYAITTPNGNRKIARSPEDVVAYCNVLMQMDMAMNSKVMAEEANPNKTEIQTKNQITKPEGAIKVSPELETARPDIRMEYKPETKPQLSARQQKLYDNYHAEVKKGISTTLSGDNLERANKLYDMLKDHIVMVKERSYSPKIEASDIIEISRNPNIDFARLENIVKHLDPNDEINLGFTLRKVMELSNEDFGKITDKLGEYSNDIRILYSISKNKSANLDRIKLFLDQIKISDDKSDNSVVYSLETVSELSDEAWDNVIKRDIIKILSDTHASYFNNTLQSLANLDNKTWDLVNKRNLINHNALRNIDVLASLSDKDFQKLIQLNIFNPTTGNLRVGEKYLSEFTNLTREQEAKLEKYNLLDRDNSQSSAKGFVGNINGSQVLAILDAPKEEFQKLVDKNLFDIKVNDRLLKTDEIIALGDSEPDVINKVINILSINPEINIKEAMVISELSKEDIAKIQKYNLFEEKVAPRLFSSNVDGEMVLMFSAFKNAKNGGAKEFVKLKPAEVIKVAQQSEESIPKLLKLLKNENIEKYSFDDLIKIAKLNDTEFEKVETIVNENKEDGNYLLAYSLNENGDNATFNEISYNQVKEFNKILDDPAYADVFIRYCTNEDGTHNAEVGNKLINLLKETHDSRLISAIAGIAKENKKQSIDPRFFDALEDAKNRGVSLHTFDLILKECTDVNGNFSQEIYNKIYELRDAQIWEGGIPQILKACKNNDGTFNDEVFKTAFKLKEMGHSIDRIGFVLQASKDQNGNFNSSLLDRIHKEVYNWNSDDFPKIIQLCLNEKGSLNEVAYENLRKLQTTGRFSQTDIVGLVPLLNVACEYSGKNNINELSIAEKRKLLKNLVSLNAQLFNKQFKLVTESLNLNTSVIPTSKEEYCSLLPKLVKSIGIDTKPLSQDVKSKYQTSIDALSKEDGALAKTNFNTGDIKLELAYPRETFISDMNNLLNELPPLERVKAMDYFGFEIKNRSDNVAQMNGYPINVNNGAKMSEISEPATKAVIEKMRPYVERFTNQNHISIKDNPALADELNNIVKAFPEFLTTIGRKQHGTHDYTIDVHTLKVLQGVITNPRFQQLPSADRKILQIATLMHDLTKAEGLVDKTHPQYSAYDTYYLLEKMNLSESDKLKVYQLIKNHDWLERLNTAGRNTEAVARDIAFDLREGNSFEMASILAEADLKGVKKNDSFYLKYQDALDRGNAKIKELVDEMQKSSIYLPQTKLPKASEIKVDGEKVKIENTKDSNGNPISNTVIYLDKDMDLSTLGFAEGLKSSDLNVLVHALNYENQSAIFQALGQVDSDALLSSSYVTYNKGNYHVFRTQGFILDVASTDIHAGTYMDFGSGCGKDMQTLKSQYLFNGNRKDLRNFFSDEFKEMLNLTDEEYLKLYNEISDKSITELDKSHPEVAKKIREMFDSMEIHKRSHGRDYNEILISRPQIQGVFWQGKVKDSDAEKHLGKKYTIDRVPEFLRKYAEENNLPIIYFGE